jgi:hypothetical protein
VCAIMIACWWAIGTAQAVATAVDAPAPASGGTQNSTSTELIGTVVAAQGDWCDQSYKPCRALWKMYPVTEASQLVPLPPLRQQLSVTVRSRWGVKETFDCSQPRELGCKQPLDLSRLSVHDQQKNIVTAFFDAVLELAADRPKVYDSFRQGILQSRGSDRQALSDGVAELTKNGLNIEGMLGSLDAGKYLLELCPLNDAGDAVCPQKPAPMNYAWNPNEPALYPARDIHPGMYRLYQWDNSAGALSRTRHYADVLVAEAAKYPAVTENFRRVTEATRSWDKDDATAPALRRAYLFTLSQP